MRANAFYTNPRLTALLKQEIGDDLPAFGWKAPETYNEMQRIVALKR